MSVDAELPPYQLDPDAGLDEAAVRELLARAAQAREEDGLPSLQLALARGDRVVLSTTIGASAGSRYVVFSVTKALVAAAVWRVLSDGRLKETTRVAEVVPGFEQNHKADVQVLHLLTHTAGFARAPMHPEEGADPERRLARFRSWRLDWAPGTRTEYHPTSAHWVLAELLERVCGTDFRTAVSALVTEPLGLTRLRLGVPEDEQDDVRDVALLGEGSPLPVLAELGQGPLMRFNEPAVRAIGVPGAGAVGDAADVVMLYQALVHNRQSLWDPDLLADATSRIPFPDHVDPLSAVPANRTLGLQVAGNDGKAAARSFGRATGPRAFGGAGIGGQAAWADPDTGLSFCCLTDGLQGDPVKAFLRSDRLSTQAARCGSVLA